MTEKITFSKLKRLSFTNSKELPSKVKAWDAKNEKWVVWEWLGIGWGLIDPPKNIDEIVEVIDD